MVNAGQAFITVRLTKVILLKRVYRKLGDQPAYCIASAKEIGKDLM